MKKKKVITFIAIIILLLILFLYRSTSFIIDFQWFQELSYTSVFLKEFFTIGKLFTLSFALIFISIWLYYLSLKKNINWQEHNKRKKLMIAFNCIVSSLFAYFFSSKYWYQILQFNNSVPFDIKDPIFNKDISFYIFKLPFLQSIYVLILRVLVFLVIYTLILYFIINLKDKIKEINFRKTLNIKSIKNDVKDFAGKQLAVVSAIILLFLSMGYIIKSRNLVYSPRGLIFGASYTDINISLLIYRIIIIVSFIGSIVVFISIINKKIKPIIISLVLIFLLILSEGATSKLVQTFVVNSNEKKLEEPFVRYNIDYTRKAFDIDDIEEINFDINNNLTAQDIKNNKESIDNIRINSFEPALEFYNQYQTIRPYYIFNDIDIDRYKINGKESQIFISARELNLKAIEPNTWQNRHLIYTHGYGVAMSKVNSVTEEGQPDFSIKDIPQVNNTDILIDNPRIYFGEKTDEYAIINTKLKEFDYPQGANNKITEYDGKSGIKMNLLNKIIFAINKKDLNFLLSRDVTRESRILINRNIVERAKKIAPFLTYDNDPHLVIHDNKLYWVIDAYTTSNKYPYSQPYEDINYIRNSAKVIIDAIDGDINFYITNKNDPIIVSYSKIFKNLFKDYSKIPEGIKEHLKYPEDIFKIQCKVFEKYHMTDTIAFLNGDDLWELSQDEKTMNTDKATNESPYVFMKLPNDNLEEMILLGYFNMKQRNTMSSMLAARMTSDNYGKLIMYRFPIHKTIYSPYFFKQKIKQDPLISKELSLWNIGEGGAKVQFGDTIILPINNSLLYVESMYLRAKGKNSAPEVKGIILSYGDKIVLDTTMDEALTKLFTKKEEGKEENIEDNKINSIKEAKVIYDKAIKAQRDGDWAKYGEYIKKLGNILEYMVK
ncbi:hypothetical protein DP149_00275 [Clostridium tetani]|uniref:UPF0182 protein CTC_00086 n=1 Tax=Clostridium tetani (strain Massachusetts / E88) TaxID=212717 RepID=Y086_CLOTE|nr:UPF0182 family protein [Clostridium tetani]Q899T2.1 RecName: Full=UPF0182 protein CTC_00086 [Clostridium tetani E88]AAO34739.1 conserved membrane protein [Clostridium tetani E88]KGI37207.1 membrane protein [Clostridium tetani]KGI41997.1 membrane protein [Clostridium tetani]KHO38874.1 membrane protein [Clostridium tetani]KIG19754.1 membrane protein [Clostridium tetani]